MTNRLQAWTPSMAAALLCCATIAACSEENVAGQPSDPDVSGADIATGGDTGADGTPGAEIGTEDDATSRESDGAELDTAAEVDTDAGGPPDDTREIEFILKNETENDLYVVEGPECLKNGPGWLVIELPDAEKPFLTSACDACSCDNSEAGAGCTCECSESEREMQTSTTALAPGEETSWTWPGAVYAEDGDGVCTAAEPPPTRRIGMRFCWKSSESADPTCAKQTTDYVEVGTYTARIQPPS